MSAMVDSLLTIRNLSSIQLELELLERFEAAGYRDKGGRTFTGLLSNLTALSSPQLAVKSESFNRLEVSVSIGPFKSRSTGIHVSEAEVLRLTFKADGERYRVDIPTPSQKSTVAISLSPNPRLEFTAVYLSASSHLSLFSSANLESWMSKLPNEIPLSALSIPGTHNSPTHYVALPSVRCQAVSVKAQLENGIRFLDVRVQPENPDNLSKDGLVLVHSAFPISLTGNKYFRDLMNTIYAFLESNPSESIILSLKREGIGRATDQQLSRILHKHYSDERWFTDNRIPSLGEARSKVVLIRRFALDDSLKGEDGGKGWAIDAESWPDNCADGTCTSGEIRVQDFYEVAESQNIHKKIGYSTDQLARAAQSTCVLPGNSDTASVNTVVQPFFMNFLSASNFFSPYCWPDKIAAKVNPSIIEYLCRKHHDDDATEASHDSHERELKGDGSTGIVVCDWVGQNADWDLVRCIVGMNAKLETK